MRNLKGALLALFLLVTLALTACGGYNYRSYRVPPPGVGAMGYAPGYRVRPREQPRRHHYRDHRRDWR